MKGSVRMWPPLALLCVLTAGPAGGGAAAAAAALDLPFMEYLDAERQVLLQWGFDEGVGNISFTLSINTSGWIGFGLSPNGNMIGADMVVGGVGTGGIYFTVSPRHTLEPLTHFSHTLLHPMKLSGVFRCLRTLFC